MQKNFFVLFFLISCIFFNPLICNSKSIFPSKGEIAPNFELPGYLNGENKRSLYTLDKFKGSKLVIYFYPEDFTAGCSLEAKGFSSNLKSFKKLNTNIIGISSDNIDEHVDFCGKENIKYPLLSDLNGVTSSEYGSWSGTYSNRNTFLLDEDGVILTRWIGVNPLHHAEEVITFISQT